MDAPRTDEHLSRDNGNEPAIDPAYLAAMEADASNEDLSTKRIFTTGEAATICKVSQQTIIRCFDSGRLVGFRVPGSKFRRIPREELIRFMKANNIPIEVLSALRKRVLAVDDDPRILDLYTEMFRDDEAVELMTASTGYDAGMLTESFRPNLIILDYMLPDINGNIVCQRVRENPKYEETKVLFVSGAVDEQEMRELMRAGGSGFVRKPFDLGDLRRQVKSLLGVDEAGLAARAAAMSDGGHSGHGSSNGHGHTRMNGSH